MGLNKDLKLVGNDFSNIATFLFVGLLCFEIPNSMFPIGPSPASLEEEEKRSAGLVDERLQKSKEGCTDTHTPQSTSSRWFPPPNGWAST